MDFFEQIRKSGSVWRCEISVNKLRRVDFEWRVGVFIFIKTTNRFVNVANQSVLIFKKALLFPLFTFFGYEIIMNFILVFNIEKLDRRAL